MLFSSRKFAARAAVVLCAVILMVTVASPTRVIAKSGNVGTSASVSYHVERDVVWRVVDGQLLTLDAYVPDSSDGERPVVILVHGGAWVGGAKEDLDEVGASLAQAGYVAVSIEYRLAPQVSVEDQVADVQAAVRWVRAVQQRKRYRLDPTDVAVLGGSAGGHLAAMVGTIGNGAGDSGDRVAAVVTWSGINDLAAVTEEGFGVNLLGCAVTECPDAAAAVSPITHVSASDAPMLIVNSSEDPITSLTQATVMAEALSTAGVERELLVVPGSAHSTQLMSAAWSETIAFLDRHLRH